MNTNLFAASLALAAVTLAGCASIVGGTEQSISVKTTPVEGAKCTLTNPKGEWYVAETPGSVTVHRAYDDLAIKCSTNDHEGLTTVSSTTKGLAFGNILFGGPIGVGVDVADGAAYDYPVSLTVPMQKK